jgi:radical SAM protein with 4Fe4S-binding SPASM domain
MCLALRHPDTVYDLRKGSLRQALQEVFPRTRERRAENQEYRRKCAVCFLRGLCGQCPAKSWMEHGTLDDPVRYLCCLAHTQARQLGLLDDGERAWEVGDWSRRIRVLSVGKSREET